MENKSKSLDQQVKELEMEVKRLNDVIAIKDSEVNMLQSTIKLSLMVLRDYELANQ